MNTRALGIAVLVSGLVIALLSKIPVISLFNCILCIWVWLGGILAVFLYQRNQPVATPVKLEHGALIGALAGIAGAFIGAIFGLIFGSINGAIFQAINNAANIGEYGQYLTAIGGFSIIGLGCDLVLYTIFGALSGLLGAAIFKPKAVPAV
jgi:hypothetical protein